jgi:hypothetical protein
MFVEEKSGRIKKWRLLQPSSSFEKHFKSHPHHTRYIPEFESDVTTNPFYHQKRRKITKIEREIARYPRNSYRWNKSDLRIVYYPHKTDRTIFPLDASTASGARYKKRR